MQSSCFRFLINYFLDTLIQESFSDNEINIFRGDLINILAIKETLSVCDRQKNTRCLSVHNIYPIHQLRHPGMYYFAIQACRVITRYIPKICLYTMKSNNFAGDLIDISAKTEALVVGRCL